MLSPIWAQDDDKNDYGISRLRIQLQHNRSHDVWLPVLDVWLEKYPRQNQEGSDKLIFSIFWIFWILSIFWIDVEYILSGCLPEASPWIYRTPSVGKWRDEIKKHSPHLLDRNAPHRCACCLFSVDLYFPYTSHTRDSWRQTVFHTFSFKTFTSKMLEARTEVQSLFLAARDPGANIGWDLKVLQCKTNMAARYDRTRWTNIHHLGTRQVPSENFLAAAEKTHSKCQYCLISPCMTGKSGKGKYVLPLFMVCTGETSLTWNISVSPKV